MWPFRLQPQALDVRGTCYQGGVAFQHWKKVISEKRMRLWTSLTRLHQFSRLVPMDFGWSKGVDHEECLFSSFQSPMGFCPTQMHHCSEQCEKQRWTVSHHQPFDGVVDCLPFGLPKNKSSIQLKTKHQDVHAVDLFSIPRRIKTHRCVSQKGGMCGKTTVANDKWRGRNSTPSTKSQANDDTARAARRRRRVAMARGVGALRTGRRAPRGEPCAPPEVRGS